METVEKKKIYQTIISAMEEIDPIGKNGYNIQQKFNYRGIDDVMNTLNPIFVKHHLFMVPEVIEQKREERSTKGGGNLIYSVCKVKYTFYAEDGSSLETIVVGEGMDSGDKASNKALAAAFKYACFQVFCIPTEEIKDPDGEGHETIPKSETRKPLPESYVNTLIGELKRTGIGYKRICANYGVNDFAEMNIDQFKNAMDILKAKPDKSEGIIGVPPDETGSELPWSTPQG